MLPHKNHPEAQVLLTAGFGTAVTGTETVMPLLLTICVYVMGGHEVVEQSRPVWQHPPPAEARQA